MTAAPDLAEQYPELAATSSATEEVGSDLGVPPGAPAADAPVDVWTAAYAELRRAYGEQAARIAQLEAEAKPPEPERWLPLKRGCGECGLDYEWTRKRIDLGLFKTRRELTTRGKPGRIFIEVNSVSNYWRRTHAK